MFDKEVRGFVDSRKRPSKALGAAFLLVLLALGGGVGYLTSDEGRLIAQIKSQSPLARPCLWVLCRKRVPPQALPALIKALQAKDAGLRADAASALGRLASAEALPPLLEAAAEDSEPRVRAACLDALGAKADAQAAPRVRAALEESSVPVLSAACRTAGALKLRDTIPTLLKTLRHPDVKARLAAQAGLEHFTAEGESYGINADAWGEWAREQGF